MHSAPRSGPPPIQLLPRKWQPRIVLALILLPLGLALCALSVLDAVEHPPMANGNIAAFTLGLALLGLLAWRYSVETGKSACLYDTHVEQVASGRSTMIPFEGIDEVWFEARRVNAGGLLGLAIYAIVDRIRKGKSMDERGVSMSVKLVGRGNTIKLNNYDKGVFAAYQEILRRVNPRLIQTSRVRLDSGEKIAFNKIQLSREGLRFGRKAIALGEIERITIKNGQFIVKRTGKWFKSGQQVGRIPNLYVLTDLLTTLSGGKIEMDVPMGMNLAAKLYV